MEAGSRKRYGPLRTWCESWTNGKPIRRNSKPLKPQSFALQVANWYLLAAGLIVLSLILIPITERRGWPLNSVPSLVMLLAFFVGERGYNMAKKRRLQKYAEEIERRMQGPSN